MDEEKKDEKKIIVDEDWKQQAQKEKDMLAAGEKLVGEKAKQQRSARRGQMPKGDFAALVSMLVTQALFAMGLIEAEGQKKQVDLEMAKYCIDMLETIQQKTKNNLTEQEEKVLSDTLNEVRMAYVKVTG